MLRLPLIEVDGRTSLASALASLYSAPSELRKFVAS